MSITTLTGGNSYRIEAEITKRIKAFSDINDANGIERIDAIEAEAETVMSLVMSVSLFTSKKLVLIRDLSQNTELSERISGLLDSPPETSEIIIIDSGMDRRGKLFKALKAKTELIDCMDLNAAQLVNWIDNYVKQNSGSISRSDAAYLVELSGTDQLRLKQEIDKLLLYDKLIGTASIDLLVEPSIDSTTFNLADAAFSRRKALSLKLYEQQRQLKVEPVVIVGSLAWQLHILALVKTSKGLSTDQIARDAGMNPWAVSKAKQLASRLTLEELSKAIDMLLKIDIRSKQSTYNTDDALANYLLSI